MTVTITTNLSSADFVELCEMAFHDRRFTGITRDELLSQLDRLGFIPASWDRERLHTEFGYAVAAVRARLAGTAILMNDAGTYRYAVTTQDVSDHIAVQYAEKTAQLTMRLARDNATAAASIGVLSDEALVAMRELEAAMELVLTAADELRKQFEEDR